MARPVTDKNARGRLIDFEERWRLREREWARKLGRLRLGVEPLEEQLARYRRAAWVLSIVPGIIALMFLSLFAVFGRPDIGLALVLILFVPMVGFSWIGYRKLARRAAAYSAERASHEAERERLSGSLGEPGTEQGAGEIAPS